MKYNTFDEFISSRVDVINEYITSQGNPASLSKYDANANVENKNVATMKAELYKDVDILLSRKVIGDIIKDEFGEDLQKEYIRQIEDHEIYVHDESSSFYLPYCVAIDMQPFIENGICNIGGESKAPKHLYSYCGNFINLIFALSSQFAGAIATPQLLLYFNYFAKKDYGKDYLINHSKLIEDHFQSMIYATNQPAMARGYQSVFLNLSLFDKYYFEGLFGNFVYPDFSKPDWDEFCELQKTFFTWLNKERHKALLTFPIMTVALLNDGKEFLDKDFVDYITKEMAEGNRTFIYTSDSADSLSSCCFSEDQITLTKDKGTILYKSFKELSLSSDKELDIYHKGEFKKGYLVEVNYDKYFYEVTTERSQTIIVTEDHLNPTNEGDKRSDQLSENDSLMYYLSNSKNEICFSKIKEIKKIENTTKKAYCFEMKDKDEPYFTLSNGIITHNCRLKNNLKNKEFNYTLTGVGVSTGSKKVITINLNRLVQDKRDLKQELNKIHKYLYAHELHYRKLLKAKMLPVYDAGFITLEKQYLTIGISGLLESAEFLGYDISYNDSYKKYLQNTLKVFKDENEKAKDIYKVMFNSELVPAENANYKMACWDKKDGYRVDRDIYSSYLYKPEDFSIYMLDKFKLHGGDIIKNLDGGSALHLNLKEQPTQEGYNKILKLMIKNKTDYLGTNVAETICNDCGYIDKETRKFCVKCNSTNIDYATRIIGYTKRVKSFSEARQIEESTRNYHS